MTTTLKYICQSHNGFKLLTLYENAFRPSPTPKPETFTKDTLDGQGSTLLDRGLRSPPVQQDHSNDVAATGDAKLSRDLWERAYEALKFRDPDLVAAYERHLAPTVANPSLSPELIESTIQSKLQDRKADQWVIRLGKQPIKVREQGEKIIRFILWFDDIISQAVSAQPYAALAWSGVSILLPVSWALI